MKIDNTYSRYPGIRSFDKEERALFFGRSRETRELYSMIKVERFVVLFSKSGLGKTSLLNAGVLPLLDEEEYNSIGIRFQNTRICPEEMLLEATKDKIKELKLDRMVAKRVKAWCGEREPSLWEYLKACSIVMAYLPATPLLVLDQFEEFFMHEESKQEIFVNLLADIIFGRVPRSVQQTLDQKENPSARDEMWVEPLNWKLVFAIRSDRLSLLDDLSNEIPAILDHRYQLHPLNKKQASEAIILPARSTAHSFISPVFSYSEGALNDIINNLINKKGEIESFQLQIICRHSEDVVMNEELESVRSKHIGGKEGIRDILNNYYENRIVSLGSAEDQRLARELIEEGLIVDGARVGLAETIVLNRYHISPELLHKIEQTRIIKPENTHLGKAYEVSHDTLVRPILNSYEKRAAIEERKAAMEERLRLTQEAADQRKKAELEEGRRRKATWVAAAAVFLLLVAIITAAFGVWALNESWVADKEKAKKEREIQERDKLLVDEATKAAAEKINETKLAESLKAAEDACESALKAGNQVLTTNPDKALVQAIKALNEAEKFPEALSHKIIEAQTLIDKCKEGDGVLSQFNDIMKNGQNAFDREKYKEAYSSFGKALGLGVDAERRKTAADKRELVRSLLEEAFMAKLGSFERLKTKGAGCEDKLFRAGQALSLVQYVKNKEIVKNLKAEIEQLKVECENSIPN